MSTELALPNDARKLSLPEPKHDGAAWLWGPKNSGRFDRLIEHIYDVPVRQFMVALAAEVNGLPKNIAPSTVVEAAFNLAVLQLIPGRVLGHAHLIPFKVNRGKPNEYLACQLIVGYKGYLDMGYGSGFLRDVQCEVVLQGEQFRRWNNSQGAQIEHEMVIGREEHFANVQAAYCIWHSRTGGHGIEVVDKVTLQNLKRRGHVWDSDTIAMCKKTPIRRAAKMWKTTGRLAQAVHLDDMAEAGLPQPCLAANGTEGTGQDRPSLAKFEQPEPSGEAEQPSEPDPAAAIVAEGFAARLKKAKTAGDLQAWRDDLEGNALILEADKERLLAEAAEIPF